MKIKHYIKIIIELNLLVIVILKFSACTASKPYYSNISDTGKTVETSKTTDYSDIFSPTLTSSDVSTSSSIDTTSTDSSKVTTINSCINSDGTISSNCSSTPDIGVPIEDNLYQLSSLSFIYMRQCMDLAAAVAPKDSASDELVRFSFTIGKLALVRCFRKIVAWQERNFPIVPQDYSVNPLFRNTDAGLYNMLNSFIKK